MNVQEQANVKVTLNNEEAKREMDELNGRIERMIQLRNKAEKEGDVKGFRKIDQELKKAQREAKKYARQLYDVDKALKNINGASWEELKEAERALVAQTRKLNRETDKYAEKSAKLTQVRTELRKINATQRTSANMWGRMADGFNRYFGMATAWLAGIAGVTFKARQAVDGFFNREDMVGNVKALTKLAGEELEFLEQKAIEFSTTTTKEGVKIQKSADQIMEAFQLVGSAKPELLKNKEALAEVTREILIQSEAAEGMALTDAIDATTKAMNQYNAGAEQASRFTNAMAAGAQVGAVQIPEIGNSIKEFGTNAYAANVPIERSVGLIELIGEKAGLVGPRAGVQLRNFFTILSAGADETNPEIVGLNLALERLEKQHLSSAQYVDMFGRENANVARIIVQNREYLDELTEAMTGTNTAYTQAIDNTTDQKAGLAQAKNRAHEYAIELGEQLAPAMTHIVSKGSLILKFLTASVKLFVKTKGVIIPLTTSIIAYTFALKLSALWQARNNSQSKIFITLSKLKTKWAGIERGAIILLSAAQALFTGNIKKATAAMRLFNMTTKLNPFAIIISLVAAAGVALLAYSKRVKDVTAAQKTMIDVEIAAQKNIVEEKIKLEQLLKVARDEKRTKNERQSAIDSLNRLAPEYLSNLTLEKVNTDEAKKATDNYIKSLQTKARVQAANQKLVEIEKELIDIDNKADLSFWDKARANGLAYAAGLNIIYSEERILRKEDELRTKQAKELNLQKENLLKLIDEENTKKSKQNFSGKDITLSSSAGSLTADEIKKRLEILEAGYSKEVALIKQKHLEGRSSEDQYNADLLEAELKFLNDKLSIYKVGSKEYEETVVQALEKQVKVDKTIKSLFLNAETELASARISNIQDGLQKQIAIENQRWTNEKQALRNRLVDKQNLSVQEIAINDSINQIIEEKEAAHQERLRNIKSAGEIDTLQKQVNTTTPIDQNFTTTDQQQAFYNARTALIESQYEKEKRLASDNQAALKSAEQKYNQQMLQLKYEQIDAEYALTEKRIGTAQNYVSMLSGVVDQESALGRALFLFNQGLAIGEVWINIAKANAKAIAASPLTMGQPWVSANTTQGAIQTGVILAQTVAKFTQNEDGKYPVMGENDGKIYDTNFAGKPKTGTYSGPQLGIFNEVPGEPEMVVDGKTTRQLMINYPAVYNGIRQLAAGFSPQFATGKYPESTEADTPQNSPNNDQALHLLTQAIYEFMEWKPGISVEKFEKQRDQYKDMISRSGFTYSKK